MKDFERRFLEAKTEKDRDTIFGDFVADIDRVLDETRSILADKGIAASTEEWITIPEYCRRFGIKNEETIISWIDRGIVPEKDIRYIPEFYNIRLIKAVKYRVRQKA